MFRDWHKWRNDQNILSENEISVYDDKNDVSKADLNFLLQKSVYGVKKEKQIIIH